MERFMRLYLILFFRGWKVNNALKMLQTGRSCVVKNSIISKSEALKRIEQLTKNAINELHLELLGFRLL